MEKGLKQFEIQFSGLKIGEHQFEFQIDEKFFEEFGFEEFEKAKLQGFASMHKRETQLDLVLKLSGELWLPCDITDDKFWLPVSTETELRVKFGNEYDDTVEDLLVLPHGEYRFNLAQYFYEMAVLAKPLKAVHPDVGAGKKGKEVLERLENLRPQNQEESKDEDTDPRWDKLKDLLN